MKSWTTQELEWLRAEYAESHTAVLAADMGRSCASVGVKAHELGLKKSAECLVRIKVAVWDVQGVGRNDDVPLTVERLRSLFHYDSLTGVFTRTTKTKHRGRQGEPAGHLTQHGYLIVRIDYKQHYVHRLAWFYVTGRWPTTQVDHIDGVRTNNSWANLREADSAINGQNQRHANRDSSTGLLGAYRSGNRFQSRIVARGKLHLLGRFATAEEAHAAYIEAKRRLHEGCTI